MLESENGAVILNYNQFNLSSDLLMFKIFFPPKSGKDA